MSTYGSMTTMPVPTPARVRRAWHLVSDEMRRSAVAAALTSLLLSAATPLAPVLRASLAAAGVVLALAALVDVHEHRLPNTLTAIALGLPVVGAVVELDGSAAGRALVGALVAGGAMLVVHLTRGVGMGDVKMAAGVGAGTGVLSPELAAMAVAVAALAAAVWGMARRRPTLPLGPSLWFGWAVAIALGSTGWWQ